MQISAWFAVGKVCSAMNKWTAANMEMNMCCNQAVMMNTVHFFVHYDA